MTKMDLAQERPESSQDTEVGYRFVDPLDDSFRGWLQQRLRGSMIPRSVICPERGQEALSKTTRMEEDQSITGQRAAKVVMTHVAFTAANDLLDLGISYGWTSLVKREC